MLVIKVKENIDWIKFIFFKVGGEWTRLPDVIPEQLQQSRSIRKAFTGNLNKQVRKQTAIKNLKNYR